MRPYIFKLMDAARDEAARFSAWVKARGLAADDWITLSGRDSNGDKHGGARGLLDDSGAIVYGLGGGHAGKKLGEALHEIKVKAAAERGQGLLFADVKKQARKEQIAARKLKTGAQEAKADAKKIAEKYAGIKIAIGNAERSEQYAREYAQKEINEVEKKFSEITSQKKLKEQYERYYNRAQGMIDAKGNQLLRNRDLAIRERETPERYEAFREAYHQMKRSIPYYQEGVRKAYEKRLRELQNRRKQGLQQEAAIPLF